VAASRRTTHQPAARPLHSHRGRGRNRAHQRRRPAATSRLFELPGGERSRLAATNRNVTWWTRSAARTRCRRRA